MNIKVAIVDHSLANVENRELFAFTKASAIKGMQAIKNKDYVSGCVILSTCNRTEMWVSYEGEGKEPYELMCEIKGIDEIAHKKHVKEKEGDEAVRHLFLLACGMKSKIFGEDQIITQVKDAIALSRECGSSDPLLEMLFRSAITSGKKIKTTLNLSKKEASLGISTAELLKKIYGEEKNINCLVIGNGEMGRLVARELIESGYNVLMTIRRYKRGDVTIPAGCKIVDYESRIECLAKMDVVVSATTSPHHTIKAEEIVGKTKERVTFIDLALPRDIDEGVGKIPGATLYDIDHFETKGNNNEMIAKANEIINEYIDELERSYYFKDNLLKVREIANITSSYVVARVAKKASDDELIELIEETTKKAVNRLMYGIRDNLPRNMWDDCITAINKGAKI